MDSLTVLSYASLIFFLRFVQWYSFSGRRFREKYPAYVDTWWFLSEARKLRRGNFKLASKYREDRIESDNHYPPLFLYLLAVIPDKYIDYAIRYGSPIVDSLLASTLFSSIALMTNDIVYGLLGVLIYLSSPMIFQQNFCLCVRPLSIFLVSVVYMVSFSFSISNFLILSILIALILLLHKFAMQVAVFTSLAFLFFGRFDYLLALMVGFLISVFISGGYYLKVLRAHVNRLRSTELKNFARSRTQNPLRRTAVLVVYCPWLTFFVVSVFILGWDIFSTLLVSTVVWIVTLTVFSVVTNFGVFRNIGEGWRYLGYLVFPMSFYTVSVMDYSLILRWIYGFVAFSGLTISYFYSQRLYRGHQKYLIDREDIAIFRKTSPIEGCEIIVYPNEFTNVVTYFSEKDYAATPELADIIVVNKELAEKTLFNTLSEKKFLMKFEEKKWIVYAR